MTLVGPSTHNVCHAFRPDLVRLVNELQPKRVVPVRTFDAERYREVFGELCELGGRGEDGVGAELAARKGFSHHALSNALL